MNKIAIAALTVAAALALAPSAAASPIVHAHTVVTWGGTDCIDTQGPSQGNPYRLSVPTQQCSFGLTHQLNWDDYGSSGQWVGVDPIMGAASWIGCTIVIDGYYSYTDYADAGDGTDVTCLRTVN